MNKLNKENQEWFDGNQYSYEGAIGYYKSDDGGWFNFEHVEQKLLEMQNEIDEVKAENRELRAWLFPLEGKE